MYLYRWPARAPWTSPEQWPLNSFPNSVHPQSLKSPVTHTRLALAAQTRKETPPGNTVAPIPGLTEEDKGGREVLKPASIEGGKSGGMPHAIHPLTRIPTKLP